GWLLNKGVPRYGAEGALLGYIGTRVDFTDRKDAKEQLSAHLISAKKTERYHIGQKLHDDLAQRITAVSISLTGLSQKYDANANLAADFDDLQRQASAICKDIVQFSYQLRPATVEGLGLPAALRDLCRHATNHERIVVFAQNENLPWLPTDVSVSLHRTAQEAVRNAVTHSGATYIHVQLTASPTTVRLSVKDNGCGFVVGSTPKHGLGLSGMSERMRNSGGRFSITSKPGRGTSITATMPLMLTQLNKITGQIRETIEKVEAMPSSPQWKPAPGQRNLLIQRIAQAKAEIAERATGLKGAERGQLVAVIYKRHLRIRE